ncbi:hypothetical protein MLD38_024581 [Melastoma candidum]|uniref:Uncharacterized protein n=1 Tax=Melastoma candidum TaxID=119954 RepID=A0ACB9NZJ1_9MYRT|nr:hypothetical protein MLD38_024581 [Melastoma candidum]
MFGISMIRRILRNFVPDEFCPDPIPDAAFESLDAGDRVLFGEDSDVMFPYILPPTTYVLPSAAGIIGEMGQLVNGSSMQAKSNTSDVELEELNVRTFLGCLLCWFQLSGTGIHNHPPLLPINLVIVGLSGSILHYFPRCSWYRNQRIHETQQNIMIPILNSPLALISIDQRRPSRGPTKLNWLSKQRGHQDALRYELLREAATE